MTFDPQQGMTPEKASEQKGVGYGPSRPEPDVGYKKFTNYKYLHGYSQKIIRDLAKVARMYNGREIKLYKEAGGDRCPVCTNLATGERILSNCKVCGGTGYTNKWAYVGNFYAYVDFGPVYAVGTPMGNTENPNGTRENIVIVGAPLVKDQGLVIFVESKEVYKVYDAEPHLVAMRGDVVTQIAGSTRLTPGAPEYKLIDW